MNASGFGLKQQVLLAALECSGGDSKKTFTAEELIVHAWQNDKPAWGLRGFENQYPDANKMLKELDAHAGKEGIVGEGMLEKVDRRVYRITPSSLAAASSLQPSDKIARHKANRELAVAVKQILEHPVFKSWITNSSRPKYFREAGHFWGIAPGTPPKAVRERVSFVERTLQAALDVLSKEGVNEIVEQRGKILYERNDIERCLEFQKVLKERFASDLRLLNPEMKY
jgi:hypothetical protein